MFSACYHRNPQPWCSKLFTVLRQRPIAGLHFVPSEAGGILITSARPTLHRRSSPQVCMSTQTEGKSCSNLGTSACSQRPSWEAHRAGACLAALKKQYLGPHRRYTSLPTTGFSTLLYAARQCGCVTVFG
jgi:hypothetical protein